MYLEILEQMSITEENVAYVSVSVNITGTHPDDTVNMMTRAGYRFTIFKIWTPTQHNL